MTYDSLPPTARIVDGVIYLPLPAGDLAPRQVQVRVRAKNGAPPSPPVGNDFTVTAGDLAAGVVLDSNFAAEELPANAPVAVLNGRAYQFNPMNPQHAYAFTGFTTQAVHTGEPCSLKALGVLELPDTTVLVPGAQYMADGHGGLTLTAPTDHAFTRIIAFALTSHVIRILNLPPIFNS